MRQIIDFHIHSKYARATSKYFELEEMLKWSEIKGIDISQGDSVVITGSTEIPWVDITHQQIDDDPDGISPWYPCALHFTEGFTITGIWDGGFNAHDILCGHDTFFVFKDDPIPCEVGQCFQGIKVYYFSLSDGVGVAQDGLMPINCALPEETFSFGRIKAMYR